MALVAFVVANILLIRFVHEPPIALFFLGTGLIGMGLLWCVPTCLCCLV